MTWTNVAFIQFLTLGSLALLVSSTSPCGMTIMEAVLHYEDPHPVTLICEEETFCAASTTFAPGLKHRLLTVDPHGDLWNNSMGALKQVTSREKQTLVLLGRVEMMRNMLEMGNFLDREMDQHEYFLHAFRWILLVDHLEDMELLNSVIGNVTNVLAIIAEGEQGFNASCHGDIYANYFLPDGQRGFSRVAGYSGDSLDLSITSSVFPNEAFGMNGRHMRIVINYWAPYLYVEDHNGTKVITGTCAEITNAMSESMNFTYTFEVPPGEVWGTEGEDGQFTGMIGMLQNREVDFLTTSFTMTPERAGVMDLSHTLWHSDSTVIAYRKPRPDEGGIGMILKPFHRWLWLAIVLVVPVAALALWLTTVFSSYYDRYPPNDEHFPFFHLRFCVWHMMGTLFGQGQRYGPTAQSGRFVLAFWWYFVVILIATYTANLVAFLTVVKVSAPFTNLEELAAQDAYTYGLMGETAWEQSFEEADMKMYTEVYAGMLKFEKQGINVLSPNHTWHLEHVTKENYAYIVDEVSAYMLMAESCEVTIAPFRFMTNPYTMGIQKHSAHTITVTNIITNLQDSGVMAQWIQQYIPTPKQCDAPGVKPIRMTHVEGMFIILAAGVIVGLLLIPLEIVTKNYMHWYCY